MTAALFCLLALWSLGGPGTSVLPVLRVGQGVRAAGLGEAYVGLADDATAVYWNPAGLGQLRNHHLSLSHHEWFSEIRDELLHASFSAGPGAFGIGLAYSGEPGIERWTEGNQPAGTFSTWSGSLALAYGFRMVRNWHFGIGLNGLCQDLGQAFGYGGAVGIGVHARLLPSLGVGVVGRNLGVVRYGSDWEMLPAEAVLGINYTLPRVDFMLDASYPSDNDLNVRAGIEFRPASPLALRLGYRTGPADIAALGYWSGLTVGLGISLRNLTLDYSFSPYGKLGNSHRLGLRLELERSGAGALLVRIVDRKTMQPLKAGIVLSGVCSHVTETDKRGELNLTGLLPGQLVIRTSAAEFAVRVDTMLILGDREQHATIALAPLEFGSIWGVLQDRAAGRPIGGTVTYRGPTYGEQVVPANTGSFAIQNLPVGTYYVTGSDQDSDYVPQTCTLEVESDMVIEHRFALARRQQVHDLQSVLFEPGQATIPGTLLGALKQAGDLMVADPGLFVEVTGHADSSEVGISDYPSASALSQARAEAVRLHLIENFGVDPERLIVRGYVRDDATAAPGLPTDSAWNRRVEFRIIRP